MTARQWRLIITPLTRFNSGLSEAGSDLYPICSYRKNCDKERYQAGGGRCRSSSTCHTSKIWAQSIRWNYFPKFSGIFMSKLIVECAHHFTEVWFEGQFERSVSVTWCSANAWRKEATWLELLIFAQKKSGNSAASKELNSKSCFDFIVHDAFLFDTLIWYCFHQIYNH